MNVQEACGILGIQLGCDIQEADKAFKKLAVKFHPDKNKAQDSEEKFKKINEAYQFLKKNGTSIQNNSFGFNAGYGMEDFISSFFRHNVQDFSGPFRRTTVNSVYIKGTIDISFSESITGCEKSILLKRKEVCSTCSGTGVSHTVSGVCKRCNGDKKIKVNGKELPCTGCGGTGFGKNSLSCSTCNGQKVINQEKEIRVSIPAGVKSGEKLRIPGVGDYVQGRYTDAIYQVAVEKDQEFKRQGNDVISNITISLLESLKGSSKDVNTCYGKKTLKIKAGIKNFDTIRVKGFGVGNSGYHIFKVNVTYPKNTQPIIDLLENYPEDDIEEIEGE